MKGWAGADVISTCGPFGSLLGGYGVLSDKAFLRKTYTDLCRHNTVRLKFILLAVDGWEGETMALYVDNIQVSTSLSFLMRVVRFSSSFFCQKETVQVCQ